jgi:hypothetical protein
MLQRSCNIENLSLSKGKLVLRRVILLHIQKKVNLSPPRKKAHVLAINAVEQEKHHKSLLPKKKAHVLAINAAEQEKHCKFLPPKKKAHVLAINAAEHKKHRQSLFLNS